MKIEPIKSLNLFKEEAPDKVAESDGSFTGLLSDKLREVQDMQDQSDIEAQKLASGETSDVHTAMMAAEKAELSLQYTMAIRNKLIEAYQEIMRMQV